MTNRTQSNIEQNWQEWDKFKGISYVVWNDVDMSMIVLGYKIHLFL